MGAAGRRARSGIGYVTGALLGLILLPVWQAGAEPRRYATGFEAIADFAGFYIVPQGHKGTTFQELSGEVVRSGRLAHKAWITGPNRPSSWFVNNNHRGYPTIQLYKLPGGGFRTPVRVVLWVWLDMEIAKGEWFSFATLDHTTSDTWDPVLVNLSDEGFVHLMHVPGNGRSEWSFQTDSIRFPQRQWVELRVELHFDKDAGYAAVWQDGQLVSRAPVRRGNGRLTQAHFGMYAPPSVTGGVVYNDDLTITEINVN